MEEDARYIYVNGRKLLRVAGGETDGGDGNDAQSGGDAGNEGGDGDGQTRETREDDRSGGSGSGSGDESSGGDASGREEDEGYVRVPKDQLDEYHRLKRTQAEADRKVKEAERKRKREEGKHDELLREAESEAEKARLEAEEAKNELDRYKRNQVVISVATRMNFHDPELMTRLVDPDAEDERAIELELRKVAKEKPFLQDTSRRTGAPVGGNGGESASPEQHLRGTIREILTGQRG